VKATFVLFAILTASFAALTGYAVVNAINVATEAGAIAACEHAKRERETLREAVAVCERLGSCVITLGDIVETLPIIAAAEACK
jgi:hypothetical protein